MVAKKQRIFEPALSQLDDDGVFGPIGFQDCLAEHGLPKKSTAPLISVDSLERLSPELREAEAMVLRLGSPPGTSQTEFAIVQIPGKVKSFFLLPDDEPQSEPFLPTATWRDLYAFQILGRLTESSLVNLSLASGLLSYALGLDDDRQAVVPATGQSTFTFDYQPHDDLPRTFTHHNGQVEIDALFFGRRKSVDCLFIVEAKMGPGVKSIAKHKLVYPILAVATQLPPGISIIPVYLHVTSEPNGYLFRVVECKIPNLHPNTPVLSHLVPISRTHLMLPLP